MQRIKENPEKVRQRKSTSGTRRSKEKERNTDKN